MNVTLHFKQLNPEFSQQVADEHFDGKENDFNFRYLWEDEINITEQATNFSVSNGATYKLQGEFADDQAFSFDVDQMMLVVVTTDTGEKIELGASNKLVKRSDKQVNEAGDIEFTFFLKGNKLFQNPFPGLFISEEHFPKGLPKTEAPDLDFKSKELEDE